MRILGVFTYIALTAVLGADALAQGKPTLWNHNQSKVALHADGTRRAFYYQTPKPDLQQIGVRSGALLFEGYRTGYQYSGTAYVFAKACRRGMPYAVTGTVSPDDRSIAMYGKAPSLDSNCQVIGEWDDVLLFTFSDDSQDDTDKDQAQRTTQNAPVQAPYDDEYNKFVDQWSECFEVVASLESINLALIRCQSALSFPRLTSADRSRLIIRKAELTSLQSVFPQAREHQIEANPTPSPTIETPPLSSATESLVSMPAVSTEKSATESWNAYVPAGVATLILLLIGGLVLEFRQKPKTSPSNTGPQSAAASPNVGFSSGAETSALTGAPSQSMSLKLRRSQRVSVTGKPIFSLDARIALNAEEHSLVGKYRLGTLLIYDSKAREKYREATNAHLELTKEQPSLFAGPAAQFLGLGKTIYRLGRASVSAGMAALSLRITVESLIRGVHIECKSMSDLLEAENAIREAGNNLKAYLETAATFDGREEIIELR